MPQYLYKNPKTGKIKEVIQGINEEHKYSEDGVDWLREFTVPNAEIDAKISPWSESQFSDKVYNSKGSYGDVVDRAAEMSRKRTEKEGKDPIKDKYFDNYAKIRKGKRHRDDPKRLL